MHHVEHALGVNEFVSRLAADTVLEGTWLREVQNEHEAAHRFVPHGGRASWIRPDAACQVVIAGEQCSLLIEYERGTLDARNLRGKLRGFVRYYESEAWTARFVTPPTLLFVCMDDRAEARVARALAEELPPAIVLTTTDWRIRADGVFGPIWRAYAGSRPSGRLGNEAAPRRRGVARSTAIDERLRLETAICTAQPGREPVRDANRRGGSLPFSAPEEAAVGRGAHDKA